MPRAGAWGVSHSACIPANSVRRTSTPLAVHNVLASPCQTVRMRFADGLTIRGIAAALDLDQRRMYTRVQRLLVEVRRRIEAEGVGCDEVLDLLDEPGADLEAGLRRPARE